MTNTIEMKHAKRTYARPTIESLGNVTELTQGVGSKPGDANGLAVKVGTGN